MVGAWLRSWRRSPLLTAQFALTVAAGIGTVTALASLMLALGYQPLPYRDPGRLVAVWERVQSGAHVMAISGPDVADFAGATQSVFSAFGGFAIPQVWLIDSRGATQVHACYIQAGVFSDLGIRPVLGRGPRPDDDPVVSGGTPPAWIGYRVWRGRYGSSPSVIGTTVGVATDASGLNGLRVRIVGVLPPGVSIPLPFTQDETGIWYLLPRDVAARSRESTAFFGLGRLRTGASVAQAQAALAAVVERQGERYTFDRGKLSVVQTLEQIAQDPARRTMGLLALGVGLVFLVACVNVAMLMGAEGIRRRREIAIRAALGASRWQLWREVAMEKCLLTLFSLGLGAAFAFALLRVLAQLVPAAGLGPPLEHPPSLNLVVLFGFAAFAMAAALVWSALLVASADAPGSPHVLAAAGGGLGYTGLSDSSRGAGRWRLILLAAQTGIGICLLAAAALAARTYATVSTANLGPAPRHTVLLSVNTRDNVILTDAQTAEFNREVLSRLERLPGTQAIALADLFPPPGWPTSFRKQGDAPDIEREATTPISVSPSYFQTLGIPILFGRGFNDTDNGGSEPVAIISLDMAEKNWATPRQAVGSEIYFGTAEESKQESKEKSAEKQQSKGESKEKAGDHYKIVGVAGDFTGYWSQAPVPTVYLPEAQSKNFCSGVILRTAASERGVAALAPQALAGMAIPATISDLSTMQARWQATLTRPMARMAGMLLLALLGLGLSVQGVYAVAAGIVAARGHELAVRSALGALPGGLAWNATRGPLLAVIVGAGFGVAASLDLRPLLEKWLGPTAVWQGEPIAIAVVLLALAAAAGCYFPARAATRTNPAEALREG
jgi:putative ABC transport system permease protein